MDRKEGKKRQLYKLGVTKGQIVPDSSGRGKAKRKSERREKEMGRWTVDV